MKKLIKSIHLKKYKQYIRRVIKDIGRDVLVYNLKNIQCPNCLYDQVHKTSLGKYNGTGPTPFNLGICPVCNGIGEIKSDIVKNIKCTVNWIERDSKEQFKLSSSGEEEEIFVKLKCFVEYKDIIKESDYLLLEGERIILSSIIKRGLGDNEVCVFYCKKDK